MPRLTSAPEGGLLENADDRALVRAAQADPARFAAVYRRYLPSVYNYVMGRVGDRTTAEDITSQVFLKALEGLPNYRPRAPFAPWIFTIARHEVVSHYRQARKQLSFDETLDSQPESTDQPQTRAVHDEQLERLGELVRALDEEKQEILRLRFGAGLTYGEVGALLGKSEAATKMAVRRLLRRLQDEWEEQGVQTSRTSKPAGSSE